MLKRVGVTSMGTMVKKNLCYRCGSTIIAGEAYIFTKKNVLVTVEN